MDNILKIKNYRTKTLIKRLYKNYVAQHWKSITITAIAMIIVAITSTVLTWLIKPALDYIFLKSESNMLIIVPVAIMLTSFIKALFTYIQNYTIKSVEQHIILAMQLDLYSHILKADLEYINSSSSGKILSRFTNDINIIRSSFTNILTGLARELLTVVFLIIMMFALDFRLSLFIIIIFPLSIIPITKLGKKMRKISHSTQEELAEYTSHLDDTLQAIRAVKSYRGEAFELQKASNKLHNILRFYIKAIKVESLSSPIVELLGGAAISGVIWYGGVQIASGQISAGSLFAFITAFFTAYKPMKSLSELNNNLQEGLAALTRLFNVLDHKPQIKNAANARNIEIQKGTINFSNVSFKYQDKNVLSNFSLEIPAGKTVALVGGSGGGKSTIINLILRFYDPYEGKILIDNQDINNVTLESLRNQISLVTQEVLLFDTTILNNIAYGKKDASISEIVDAAKYSFAHDFINELHHGYESEVGQKGFKLSGGQKQRISIARAILRDSPILILDEATSALDNITEKQIQASLQKIRKDKTTIIIAHRLSTIVKADIIFVLDEGRVVEQGTHSQLIKKDGLYSKLYSLSSLDT
jgi:ATP-binding cassette, subfamily B, bacterial MsbA